MHLADQFLSEREGMAPRQTTGGASEPPARVLPGRLERPWLPGLFRVRGLRLEVAEGVASRDAVQQRPDSGGSRNAGNRERWRAPRFLTWTAPWWTATTTTRLPGIGL